MIVGGRGWRRLGERLRRLALGLTAALVTARAFWPSEPDLKRRGRRGLYWVSGRSLSSFGLALAAVPGRRPLSLPLVVDRRCSVVGLMVLVAMSASHAARPAAGDQPGLGVGRAWARCTCLLRNLPRTRDESSALAGVMVATAFAVSVYGLYQLAVELPMLRVEYLRNPQPILHALEHRAGQARRGDAQEPVAVFERDVFDLCSAPIRWPVSSSVRWCSRWRSVLQNLVRRDAPGSRWTALVHGGPGDSRPAGLPDPDQEPQRMDRAPGRDDRAGLALARDFRLDACCWRRVPGGLVVVVAMLVVAGLAAGRLDREVLTQSTMSLRYRWEYWQGAWGVITGGAANRVSMRSIAGFLVGSRARAISPDRISSTSCRRRAKRSWTRTTCFSRSGRRPASGLCWPSWPPWRGVCGICLVRRERQTSARGAGVRDRGHRRDSRHDDAVELAMGSDQERDGVKTGSRAMWLVGFAGIGGWVLVVLLGRLNPFEPQMAECWLILGMGWLAAVGAGAAVVAAVTDSGGGSGGGGPGGCDQLAGCRRNRRTHGRA